VRKNKSGQFLISFALRKKQMIKMRNLIFLILISSASGIFITCRFNYDYGWVVIGDAYACEVTSVNFDDNPTHITSVNGVHLPGHSNANVGMINFGYNNDFCYHFNLTVIPKGFLNFFPNFIGMAYGGCSVNFLNGDELEEYSNLEFYVQSESNLIRVPGNFFASNRNMKVVGFYSNQIQHVGTGLLDNLQHLQEVWVYDEICISMIASNPSEIPALIETLRKNCPDFEPPRCEIEDLENFVCGLDEKIEHLKTRVEILEGKNKNLSGKMRKSEEKFDEKVESLKGEIFTLKVDKNFLKSQVEDLEIKNEDTKEQTENLKSKNEALKNQLESLKKSVENLKVDKEILANQLEKLNAESEKILQQLEQITL
jgi:predicted  nucleic acid-binding Zn-ribbon protein